MGYTNRDRSGLRHARQAKTLNLRTVAGRPVRATYGKAH